MEFLTADTILPPYMVFPRFLIDMPINETAKILYMVLLDRARLSQKNEGWTDENGYVFFYFTIDNISKLLHKSQMTVKTSLSALEDANLLFRKRQGVGRPNKLYVKLPPNICCQTDRSLALKQPENCPNDRQYSCLETDKKLSCSNNYIEKHNITKRESNEKRSPCGTFHNVFLSSTELENLQQTIPTWQEYIERLSSYMASTGKNYQNHAAAITSWAMKDHPVSQQRRIYKCEEYESL